MNEPIFLFLSVASVALFSFVAVVVWSQERRKEREAYCTSETVKKIAEGQKAGGGAAIEYLREMERSAVRRRQEGLKVGALISAALGTAMMIFIRAMDPQEMAFLVGLIPLLIGVAMLAYVYLLAAKA